MGEQSARAKHLVADVLGLLNALDVYGLDPGADDGAPADEYNAEATAIASRLLTRGSISAAEVDLIWTHWFGGPLGTDPQRLSSLVADLNALVREGSIDETSAQEERPAHGPDPGDSSPDSGRVQG